MNEDFEYLFHYLEKEEVLFDKFEFLFQIQSHPDYPSLLAVTDTLSFFRIKNGAIKVTFSELNLLPNRFITLLKDDNGILKLCFIEKTDNSYFYTKDKRTTEISISSLKQKWNEIVLLIENSKVENLSKKKTFHWILPSLTLIVFAYILSQLKDSWYTKLFFIFPLFGMLFSVTALKDLFESKIKIFNNLCNISSSTNCTSIVNSDKWKIFKYIQFSDLSIIFFITQLIGLLSFVFLGESITFLSIQKILLILCFPIVLSSLYFQKYVEKKWCPICLAIIGLILLELGFLILFLKNTLIPSFHSIVMFGFFFMSAILMWSVLKTILLKLKELKEFQLKANRFIRNYKIFKNNLLSNQKIELPQSQIILGNKNSKTKITIITNPFCGHCKEAHKILDSILEKYNTGIHINIIVRADIKDESEDVKFFFRSLIDIYLEKGEVHFKEALLFWFENKNLKQSSNTFKLNPINIEKIDTIYDTHNNWCMNNGFSYTPAIFINGYEYPNSYEREYLEFFINDLIEDDF